MEVETETLLARDLGYLPVEKSDALLARAVELGKILNGLINSIRQVA